MKKLALLSLVSLVFVVACGGAKPKTKLPDIDPTQGLEGSESMDKKKDGPSVSQELGSIDQKAVEASFTKLLNGPLEKCHKDGHSRIDYLSGDMKVFLRIDQDGKVKYGYFEESKVGDRDTERCVLDALKATDWPKPDGGEAEVRNTFHWEPGAERAPTQWEAEKVLSALDDAKDVKGQVIKCKANVQGDILLTGYVEHDESAPAAPPKGKPAAKPAGKGKPGHKKGGKKGGKQQGGKFKALGAAATSKEAAEKADCVVEALKGLSLPSPGSYAAKVSFVL
jgi:hypothetical protein